jgi:hypothetical protein
VFTARYGLCLYNRVNLGLLAYIADHRITWHRCQYDLAKSAVAFVLKLLWVWLAGSTDVQQSWRLKFIWRFVPHNKHGVIASGAAVFIAGTIRNWSIYRMCVWQCYMWCYLQLPLLVSCLVSVFLQSVNSRVPSNLSVNLPSHVMLIRWSWGYSGILRGVDWRLERS